MTPAEAAAFAAAPVVDREQHERSIRLMLTPEAEPYRSALVLWQEWWTAEAKRVFPDLWREPMLIEVMALGARVPRVPERVRRRLYQGYDALRSAGLVHGLVEPSAPLRRSWERDRAWRRLRGGGVLLGRVVIGDRRPRDLMREGLRPRNFAAPLDVAFEAMLGCDLERFDGDAWLHEMRRQMVAGPERLLSDLSELGCDAPTPLEEFAL